MDNLTKIKEFLKQDIDFIKKDSVGNNMYSEGFNHYYKFVTGKALTNVKESIKILDEKMQIGEKSLHSINGWKKSSIIRNQSLEAVNYCC